MRAWNYSRITEQTEKTMNMLMTVAHRKTSSEFSKEQAVQHAVGAFTLWQDLTRNHPKTEAERQRLFDDDRRLFKLLVAENPPS